ncbi:hypothetical protein AVEN_11471-1 [Araneus ventricosus]|uniref:Uncharacterized protein n=1 Tax=Araneus ventricosus TaxID=182803 RepID=A0A4Y2U3K7_ARAVE|nr:hypothetical protein AVEN_11471-1 [Araneus ventricosus]
MLPRRPVIYVQAQHFTLRSVVSSPYYFESLSLKYSHQSVPASKAADLFPSDPWCQYRRECLSATLIRDPINRSSASDKHWCLRKAAQPKQ